MILSSQIIQERFIHILNNSLVIFIGKVLVYFQNCLILYFYRQHERNKTEGHDLNKQT